MKRGNIYGRGARAKATVLHSKIVRARSAVCERCRSRVVTDCAHIVSRSYSWTRTDENNAWALCRTCHMFLTREPFEHVQFAIQTRGEAGYQKLREKALQGVNVKFDWDAELARLTEVATELGII